MNSYKTNKFAAITCGKFSEFKKEEYHIMMNRVKTINNIMTEKCRSVSLKPLGVDFRFDFEFVAIDSYLKKTEDFDKKTRKDPLKKWWMNQKASEMASTFLPAILDKIDTVSLSLSQHEKSELLQNKLMKYVQFELLQCALECKFTRPRAAPASVFPNTSFQYARSRLRKKLENVYFTESETNSMRASDRKKKEEWIKAIAQKKTLYKHEYYKEKLKKQKQKKKQKRIQKQLQKQRGGNRQISISSSITISSSMRSTTASSDLPIIDAANHNLAPFAVPPPPPLPELNSMKNMEHMEMKMPIYMNSNSNPKQMNNVVIKQKENRYCSDCTMYSMELSKVTEELERYKMSLGSTQMELQQAIQEINEWKVRYNEYKDKYDKKSSELKRLQSQIGSLISNSSATQHTGSASISQEMSTSFPQEMSISRGSSINRYQYNMHQKDNTNSGDKINSDMSQIIAQHLKHNSNSTEKMLEQLRSEHNDELEYGLCQEEENILFPITSNHVDNMHNNKYVDNVHINNNNGAMHPNYVNYQPSLPDGTIPNAPYDAIYQTTSNESIDDNAMLMNNWNGNHFHQNNPFPPDLNVHI